MCRIEGKRQQWHTHTKQRKMKENKQIEVFHFFPFQTEMARVFDINMQSKNKYCTHHKINLISERICVTIRLFYLLEKNVNSSTCHPLVGGDFKLKTVPASLWNLSNFVLYVPEIEFYHCIGCGNNRNAFKYAWKSVVNYFSLSHTRSVKRKYWNWHCASNPWTK